MSGALPVSKYPRNPPGALTAQERRPRANCSRGTRYQEANIMSTATCPHCGYSLAVTLAELDGPAPRPSLRFEAGPGDLPIARPRPVSRGTGPDRLKAWGAVADTPLAPGDRLQIVAKSGKTWAGTVAECLGGRRRWWPPGDAGRLRVATRPRRGRRRPPPERPGMAARRRRHGARRRFDDMTDPATIRNAEHERALVACALVGGPDVAREMLAAVQAPMLADPRRQRAWSALGRILQDATGPVVLLDALDAELGGDGGEAPTLVELHDLTAAVPSAANWRYYAERVRRAYARRWLALRTPETIERNPQADEAELLAGLEHGARRVRELLAGPGAAAPVVVSAAEYADAPQPAPVLWRDRPAAPDSTDVDTLLSVGEVALLSSAGGLGKSTLVLDLASAAVAAAELGALSMAACGLAVAAGPVLVVSYEDAPARIAHRLTWCNAGNVPAAVHVAPDPAPLWVAAADRGGESHPGPDWERLWQAVRDLGARLVVIDPVSAALADVSTSETGPVRAFLRPDRGADGRRRRCPAGGARHEGGAQRRCARRRPWRRCRGRLCRVVRRLARCPVAGPRPGERR